MLWRHTWTSFLLLCWCGQTNARAILGIDLGSLYMKVALVQSGSPLEIVTNLHSKRKTEQMILFDGKDQQRFYGADADALLARKSSSTPSSMSVLLGRDDEHPSVKVLSERHFPVTPYYNETRLGLSLKLGKKDTDPQYTPEELVAMVLQHAVDISTAYAAEQGHSNMLPPKDVVITVPSFATQRERMALLDAAALVDLNVLLLIDDNTAAALQYSMDKTFADATNEHSEDQWILFYNVGATSVQSTLVHFYSYLQPQKYGKPKRVPTAEVVSKAWDATAGGLALDHVLVEHLADAFEQQNPQITTGLRDNVRAMTKLRIQANKIKHVLSANADIPVMLDALHNDAPLQKHMTRAELETLAAPLIQRAVQPALDCLARANKTVADLTAVELIGGGMRVPAIQSGLQAALGLEELGLHMNSDESMALGAAFAGANHSTAFRVRHIGLVDVCPFAYQVTLSDLEPSKKSEEEWRKQTTIFKSFGKMGIKKTITFTHEEDCLCQLDYADDSESGALLPEGSERALLEYSVTGIADFAKKMKDKGAPKISLQFELSSSGIAQLVKAEASVEETYMAQEEVEVDDEDAVEEEEASETASKDGEESVNKEEEASEESNTSKTEETETPDDADKKDDDEKTKEKSKDKKPKAKPKKRITVEKEKTRTIKETLTVITQNKGKVQPLSPELLEASRAKLAALAEKDKLRILREETRNKLESYIYKIKNTIQDVEGLKEVATEEQLQECMDLALAAQEWMDDDGYGADIETMEQKYSSLSEPFEKIQFRYKEKDARPAAVAAMQKQLDDIEKLMENWSTSKPQVTEDERSEILEEVELVKKWLAEKESEQAAKSPQEEPAFVSTDVPKMIRTVEKKILQLSKKPKPKPPKKEKNETKAENETATEGEDASTAEASADEGDSEQATKDKSSEGTSETKEESVETDPSDEL